MKELNQYNTLHEWAADYINAFGMDQHIRAKTMALIDENDRLWDAFRAATAYIHGGQDRGEESQTRYSAWIEARDKVAGRDDI